MKALAVALVLTFLNSPIFAATAATGPKKNPAAKAKAASATGSAPAPAPVAKQPPAAAATTTPVTPAPQAAAPAPASASVTPAATASPAVPPVTPATAAPAPIQQVPPAPTNVPLAPAGTAFLDSFPKLRSYLFEEPQSGFYFGFGFSPIGLLGNSFMFTGNFFQLHWLHDNYDIELINASYSVTRGQSAEFQSTHFTFRSVPKYRVWGPISVGPVLGYELVSFPNLTARILRGSEIEPNSEPFSVQGWIFGVSASQTFPYGKGYMLKFNESFYRETYNANGTVNGWNYYFNDRAVQQNRSSIAAGNVIMFEANLLY